MAIRLQIENVKTPKFSSFTYAHLTTIVVFIAKKKGKKSRHKIEKREKERTEKG